MSESDKQKCGCSSSVHAEESQDKKIKRPTYYGAKRAILGEVITEVNATGRGLQLSKNWSRSVLRGEIHEIMLTGSIISPGDALPEFRAIAFFKATQGSHSVIGDKLYLNDAEVGVLIGYEMNHMPNHMNIVFKADGKPEFKLGDLVKIQ